MAVSFPKVEAEQYERGRVAVPAQYRAFVEAIVIARNARTATVRMPPHARHSGARVAFAGYAPHGDAMPEPLRQF